MAAAASSALRRRPPARIAGVEESACAARTGGGAAPRLRPSMPPPCSSSDAEGAEARGCALLVGRCAPRVRAVTPVRAAAATPTPTVDAPAPLDWFEFKPTSSSPSISATCGAARRCTRTGSPRRCPRTPSLPSGRTPRPPTVSAMPSPPSTGPPSALPSPLASTRERGALGTRPGKIATPQSSQGHVTALARCCAEPPLPTAAKASRAQAWCIA